MIYLLLRKRSLSRLILFCMLLVLQSCGGKKNPPPADNSQQEIQESPHTQISEDKSQLEKLYDLEHMKEWYPKRVYPPPFDFGLDLSRKNPRELWLLRNEIFARNGYLFNDAVLRGYFNQFDWYQPVFDVPEFKVTLTKEETDFVARIEKLEAEAKPGRIVNVGGYDMIAPDHILNTVQFAPIDESITDQLAKFNFAIVPGNHEQLHYLYDKNHYEYVPSFVTTDLFLQLVHKYSSTLLRDAEEARLRQLLSIVLENSLARINRMEPKNVDQKLIRDWTSTYISIGLFLMDSVELDIPARFQKSYTKELSKIIAGSAEIGSEFLRDDFLDYRQFIPRGNYTSSFEMEAYWRTFSWLKATSWDYDSDAGLMTACVIAASIRQSDGAYKSLKEFNEVLGLVAGREDSRSIADIMEILTTLQVENPWKYLDKDALSEIRRRLKALPAPSIASNLKREFPVYFMAGRYSIDAEILSKVTDQTSTPSKRPFPKGIDVMSAFGKDVATRILMNDFQEDKTWDQYKPAMDRLRSKFGQFKEWDSNFYNKRMELILTVDLNEPRSPLFMKTQNWEIKSLQTAMAGWAELKHELLLYSEQPYAAEAGDGGGPPPPKHIGFVEPNVAFWKKAIDLLQLQARKMSEFKAINERSLEIGVDIGKLAAFLLEVSQKELAGRSLSQEEHDKISWIGGEIEYLLHRIYNADHIPEDEKRMSVVADVFSNPIRGFLEEGVGFGDEIYAVVEVDGKAVIARGAVFSYYEFISSRPMTDVEWTKLVIDEKETPPRPAWESRIIVQAKPLKSLPSYSLLDPH